MSNVQFSQPSGLDFSEPVIDGPVPFQDVREGEREALASIAKEIKGYETAIAMADGLLGMAQTGGYKQFMDALRDMKKHRVAQLLAARTDRDSALFTGRCQELDSVISLVGNTAANKEGLAKALKQAQDAYRSIEQRIPEAQKP